MATLIGKFKMHSLFKKSIKFSTACAVQDHLPRFRTLEDRPSLHAYNHVGKFYKMDDAVKEKLFFSGGIPHAFELQMKTFREYCIMIREPYLEVLSYLQSLDFSQPAVRFVIYGKYGTGKTTTLMHVLHYGYENKYLLVHLPWVSNWTKQRKEVIPSQFEEGMFDLPVQSGLWLQHFKLQNRELMEELDIKTSQSYTWSQREVTEKGEPLMAVVEHGIQRGRHSSDCIAVLLKEIKIQSSSNKFKTMVVVDGVNAFYHKTNVIRPDRTLILTQEITICKAFLKILQNDWNNAVIVASVDSIPFIRGENNMKVPYTPRALLGKMGFELLDPFVPIQTTNYSEKEIESVLDYYVDRLWIQSEKARSEKGRKQLKFLSGYNPVTLMEICDPL